MADAPPITDVFKFVAVRPAQLAHHDATHLTTIRDQRAATPEGARKLAQLARALAVSGEALARWKETDLSALQPIAKEREALLALYQPRAGAPAAHPPTDAVTALKTAQVRRLEASDLQSLLGRAWDALYTGYLTGPDAGPRLEVPTAALRMLHFLRLAATKVVNDPDAAVRALRATPLVSEVFRHAPAEAVAAAPPELRPSAVVVPEHVRALVSQVIATQRLAEAASAAPALSRPVVRIVSQQLEGGGAGGTTRSSMHVDTAPRAGVLVREGAYDAERHVMTTLGIDALTALPVAAALLHTHLEQLTTQALQMGGDPALAIEVQSRAMHTDLARVLGAKTTAPPLAPIDVSVGAAVDPSSAPDVNVSGRIRPLGIGDLKVVKQVLLAYVPGEVAHIETVLKGESKQRIHRSLDRSQTTVFTSEEETRETTRDTQSTDRFEVKKEAEQTLKEDLSIQAGITATGTYGPVTVTAHGDFAYSVSSESSQHQSSNYAREVIDKSVTRVQTRNKTERTVTILHEAEETNTHGLDNTKAGAGHINGIYRWVDKRYRAQVYNYGKRLMLEFVVPEPAAFYRAAVRASSVPVVDGTPPDPFVNVAGAPLSAQDITPVSYKAIAARYGAAGLVPPPAPVVLASTAVEASAIEDGHTISKALKDFNVPEGYNLAYYSAAVSLVWSNHPRFSLLVGRDVHTLQASDGALHGQDALLGAPGEVTTFTGSVPVSLAGYDINALAVNVQGVCWLTPLKLDAWRHTTYDKIYAAYQALRAAYDQKVSQSRAASGAITITGQNPGINRQVERRELKKLCLTMLTGQHFRQFKAMTDPSDAPTHHPEVEVDKAMHDGRIIQFFEQAFEWEQLTYLYYPYFWGRKTNWVNVTAQTDPDPLFAQFLTAGAARVLVPVSRAYDEALLYYLETPGTDLSRKIWQGGESPRLDDPLYVSIADELRAQTDDLAGATPEGEPWEFSVPTTLVWLQPTDALPAFP